MAKTKILIITTIIAAIVVVALVGATYAQTLNTPTYNPNLNGYSESQQTQGSTATNGAYVYDCPGINGAYSYGSAQGTNTYRMGMRGGMMGGYYP
jgi:hypothetical protein